MPLVECVPNFSEGRDPERVAAIVRAIEGPQASSARVLDSSLDADHHRSVVTFVAQPEDAVEAVLRGVRAARDSIDLNEHRGVHPRIGAADVVPFVPLEGTTLEDCVALALAAGERIAGELEIPVYLYGAAARSPERRGLAALRRGGFEFLRALDLSAQGRAPDLGPARLHPTAGASCVGARGFLLAFNVWLASDDLDLARRIARRIRERDGGLPGVQALGLALASAGLVQVSTNIVDLEASGLVDVFEAVSAAARAAGVEVHSSELIGLAPRQALTHEIAAAVRLRGFDASPPVLEDRLR